MAIGSFGAGFLMGFGTGFVAREAVPFVKEIVTPLSKLTAKTLVRVFEKSREGMARMGEAIEDMVAEVRHDLKKDKQKKKRVKARPAVVGGIERTA